MSVTPIDAAIITAFDAAFDQGAARQLTETGKAATLEQWLDTVADELAEFGWTTQSITSLVPSELVGQLRQEVKTLHRTEALDTAGIGRGTDHTQDRSVRRDQIAPGTAGK